jgi:hypothetical protein
MAYWHQDKAMGLFITFSNGHGYIIKYATHQHMRLGKKSWVQGKIWGKTGYKMRVKLNQGKAVKTKYLKPGCLVLVKL